jgi:DNA-binding MarR family transcriptional regulator
MTKPHSPNPQPSAGDLLVPESEEQATFVSIIRTAGRLEGELNRLLRPFELTTATYTILKILDRIGGDGLSCGDIAAQLIAEVPDMTRLLDRLERLEYVMRERSRVDRRMVKVKITARGADVVQGLREPVQECHRRQLSHLQHDKLVTIQKLLAEVHVSENRRGDSANMRGHSEDKPQAGV